MRKEELSNHDAIEHIHSEEEIVKDLQMNVYVQKAVSLVIECSNSNLLNFLILNIFKGMV